MQETKKISIIIPVYNTEKYLYECLESIKKQTFDNFEVIIIDDGSTDLSSKICDDYAKSDDRFHVLHKKNEGVSFARRDGIALATGDYITFVDSDDYFDFDFLERVIPYCNYDYDVIQWGIKREQINNKSDLFIWNSSWCLDNLLEVDSTIWHSFNTKMIKNDILKKNKFIYDKNIYIGEDFCFSIQLYSIVTNIYNIQNYAPYHYRFYDNTMTNITEEKLNNLKTALLFAEKNTEKSNISIWKTLIRSKKEELKLNYLCLLTPPAFDSFRNCFPEIKRLQINKKTVPFKRKFAFYMSLYHCDLIVKLLFSFYRYFKK